MSNHGNRIGRETKFHAEKINAAIVGLGRIASLLEDDSLREKPATHAGAVAANPDCRLVAGCDIDEERRRLFARRWQVPVYTDAESMLAEHRPEILHIATHPDSHLFYCRLAASCGVPLVVCEKPLADSLKDARSIAALHQSGKIKILTNHERRYSADYIRMKEILGSGRMGALLSARACLCFGKNRRLDEMLWHDGTHLADALMFLSGGILKHEKCWGARLHGKTGTSWLAGSIHSIGGGNPKDSVPFVIELGAGRDHLVFEMEFSCEQGRLRIGNGIFEVWESDVSPYAEKFRSLKKTAETFHGPTGYFAGMEADAAACVRDRNRRPRSSASDGLAAVEYLQSVTGRI
ncbi:MAG: Gfo/Idh/MocA family oxidoreductase [Treponema sp.]|jgi:predicted dehydrogenase|nr:Gfo/Idh/MocA family oxidoreductase [Treponema sp.]